MQPAPVDDHEHRSQDGKWISRGRVVENSGHPFQRRQRRFSPYLYKSRPVPIRERDDLVRIEIGRISDGRKSGKLENEVTEPKKGKGKPDAFKASDAPKTIAERLPHRIKKHQQDVSTAEPKQSIYSRETRYHAGEISA